MRRMTTSTKTMTEELLSIMHSEGLDSPCPPEEVELCEQRKLGTHQPAASFWAQTLGTKLDRNKARRLTLSSAYDSKGD